MKRIKPAAIIVGLFLLGLGLGIFAAQGTSTGLKGPYLGQAAPGKQPILFAPGIVSKAGSRVSACTFSPDGKEFYYTDQTKACIMVSLWTDQGWSVPAPFSVSAAFRAFEPHVTLDNKRIYWNGTDSARPGLQIFYAERTAQGWSAPRPAGEGMFVSSSRDGRVYVTHMGAKSDYVSRAVMDGPRIVGYEDLKGGIEKIRARSDSVAHPCIAPDGSYIVFDIEGGPHLFVSFLEKDGTWGEAVDLALQGLDPKAGMASITPDGKYLFVSQAGDILWVSTRLIEDLRPKSK